MSGDSCQVDWCLPTDDGGAAVTSYIVEKAEIPSVETTELNCAREEVKTWHRVGLTHSTRMIVYRLGEGVTYRFRVRAENALGCSDVGQESDCITMQPASSEMNYDALGEFKC